MHSSLKLDHPHSVGCFPSLKVVNLRVSYPDQDLMKKLFDECPVLEDLTFQFDLIRSNEPKLTLNVSSPTLKKLSIKVFLGKFGPGYYGHRFVFKTPKLEYINIQDDVLLSYSNKGDSISMPCLTEAVVGVGHSAIRFETSEVQAGYAFKILGGITTTKSLDLSIHTMAALISYSNKLPQFLKLTELKLEIHVYFGWNLLTHFLENSPILEVLEINKVPAGRFALDDWGHEKVKHWNTPGRMTSCLWCSCIKEIKINDIEGLGYELKGVKYLLRNATVLEKMVVRPYPDADSTKQRCQNILKFPMASKSCQNEIL